MKNLTFQTMSILIPVLIEEYKNEQTNPDRLCLIMNATKELGLTETYDWMVDNLTPNEHSYYAAKERPLLDDEQQEPIPVVIVVEPIKELKYPASKAIAEKYQAQADAMRNALDLSNSMLNRTGTHD